MVFAWLRRRAALAELREVCGVVEHERIGDLVRAAAPACVVEWRRGEWRALARENVAAPARMLHPSAASLEDDAARTALANVVRHEPHAVEIADGVVCATFLGALPRAWDEFERDLTALAASLRGIATALALACPSCDAPLRERAGEASCSTCRGRLVLGDVARERIFDPRNIAPGALKDASVGRGIVARCPSCTSSMAPVLVDDVVVDVCRGCGALWCDEGEYTRLAG